MNRLTAAGRCRERLHLQGGSQFDTCSCAKPACPPIAPLPTCPCLSLPTGARGAEKGDGAAHCTLCVRMRGCSQAQPAGRRRKAAWAPQNLGPCCCVVSTRGFLVVAALPPRYPLTGRPCLAPRIQPRTPLGPCPVGMAITSLLNARPAATSMACLWAAAMPPRRWSPRGSSTGWSEAWVRALACPPCAIGGTRPEDGSPRGWRTACAHLLHDPAWRGTARACRAGQHPGAHPALAGAAGEADLPGDDGAPRLKLAGVDEDAPRVIGGCLALVCSSADRHSIRAAVCWRPPARQAWPILAPRHHAQARALLLKCCMQRAPSPPPPRAQARCLSSPTPWMAG